MLQSKDHYKSSVPVFRKEKEVEIKSIQRISGLILLIYRSTRYQDDELCSHTWY